MPNHIIPMQLTEDNVNILMEITDIDSIQMELEELTGIPMLVHLSYGYDPTAVAGFAIAGIAVAGLN